MTTNHKTQIYILAILTAAENCLISEGPNFRIYSF